MDKKSKFFLALFFVLIAIMVGVTYYKIMVLRDYQIATEVECDPATEKCFIYVCDPAEDDTCSEDPAEQISYYKIVHKNASNIAQCEPAKEECEEPKCEPGEVECEEILCNEAELKEGEACSDPATFQEEAGEGEENADAEEAATEDDRGAACESEDESCNLDGSVSEDDESTTNEQAGEDGLDDSSPTPEPVLQ